jgi:putative ABC transport system substrate-binding protein
MNKFLIITVGLFAAVLCSVAARAETKIGILLFSEAVRFHESKNSILEQLKKDGFGEPAVEYTTENALGSKAKAAEVARKFAAAKFDLIFTLGTPASIPMTKAITDVPIVFCHVYDPVDAGIAKDWQSSGNNTTGASSRISMAKLLNILKEFRPVKRLAVLYTPGEKNTEAQLIELQKSQEEFQIKVLPIILTNKEEVAQTVAGFVNSVDAIYLTGSTIIGGAVPAIVDIANKARVITITHLDDLVEQGALLGVCANSPRLGRLAGEKAVRILQGAQPSSIPIETVKELDIILNKKTAKAGQFALSPSFLKSVTKTVE